MTNRYQNAEVSFSNEWLATQVLDGAMFDAFSFDSTDLDFYTKTLSSGPQPKARRRGEASRS